MKSIRFIFSVFWIIVRIIKNVSAQEMCGVKENEIKNIQYNLDQSVIEQGTIAYAYLCKGTSNLTIDKRASTETYEAYFHIPVVYREQAPVLIEVESPHLIDYRFIDLSPPNVMVTARMRQADSTSLNWTAWVFIKENRYLDLPSSVPLPSLEQLPDSVKKWLGPTDCVQINAAIVQQIADSIRENKTNLIDLANAICSYCRNIPWPVPHSPMAFDAVYALTWGSSCTGHAHAGAALFRANGIPARTLLTMPVGLSNFHMHWAIDYLVPNYGWVRMETSAGQHPSYPQDEIVTLACNPEDEFPLFFPSGIEGYWHTSDPILGMFNPDWRRHSAVNILNVSNSSELIDKAHSLTESVFNYYSRSWGINLTLDQQVVFQNALNFQKTALAKLKEKDLDGYIRNLQQALNNYENVHTKPAITIFFDDFESGLNGWTHGGQEDEWELGYPTFGPSKPHSENNCWGIDLDNTYENNANCWLKSPSIDLTNYACAYLSFWVWNWVEDENQGWVYDPLWLDIAIDDTTYFPLCSHFGGVNDDPVIPDVGGWTMLVLDLTKYIGNMVQIRFRFESDADDVQPGSYIDDFHVYGRAAGVSAVESITVNTPVQAFHLSQNYPNPFNSTTHIDYMLLIQGKINLVIYNTIGEKICTLVNEIQTAGKYIITWNGSDDHGNPFASGMYFYRLQVEIDGDLTIPVSGQPCH